MLEDTPVDITFEDDTVGPTPPEIIRQIQTGRLLSLFLFRGIEADTVGLKVVMINNTTYDVAIIIDNAQIDTTEFPHYVVVDVPETGGYTVEHMLTIHW